ncbi:concanavalin A-like lectin/glucanases superfamily protein [Terrimicrobium sacchariphilum]|uniref:Concanavalin A-like lectin/glucanases superfamily protein n=1 Tax=Terrimicrobium sacchariphilum TaxID=690879 RepID=A0A146G7N1_TERSA|nr:LamG-like jellyroll fold domain-containing protein [Terrimicrobium sacchariphilum]GAT32728.1 concanavalin A-like lectin/glucanases superfamily protein [Terrimicrobium sacchariphilum]
MKFRHLFVVLVSLASAHVVHAQQELLRYSFNDPDLQTTTTADAGPDGHTLTMYSADGEAAALQTGSGVSGKAGDHSFNNSRATGMGRNGQGGWAEGSIRGEETIWQRGMTSFTVTGWFQPTESQPSDTARIVYIQPSLNGNAMTVWAVGGGRLELRLDKQVDGGQSDPVFGSKPGEWNFFAVTFDATKRSDNIHYYAGTDSSSVREVGVGTLAMDRWTPARDGSHTPLCIIGNGGRDVQRPFQGHIDEIRLFGAESGSGGALSQEKLEEIRCEALVP